MELGQVQVGADLVVKAKLEGGKLIISQEFEASHVLDSLIDTVEKAIPGDQTGLAAAAKASLKMILG